MKRQGSALCESGVTTATVAWRRPLVSVYKSIIRGTEPRLRVQQPRSDRITLGRWRPKKLNISKRGRKGQAPAALGIASCVFCGTHKLRHAWAARDPAGVSSYDAFSVWNTTGVRWPLSVMAELKRRFAEWHPFDLGYLSISRPFNSSDIPVLDTEYCFLVSCDLSSSPRFLIACLIPKHASMSKCNAEHMLQCWHVKLSKHPPCIQMLIYHF